MSQQFFDSDGFELPAKCVRQAKSLKPGDMLVFNTKTRVLQIKRHLVPYGINYKTIQTAFLPMIVEKGTFHKVVQAMCDIARISGFQENTTVPKHYLAFRLG